MSNVVLAGDNVPSHFGLRQMDLHFQSPLGLRGLRIADLVRDPKNSFGRGLELLSQGLLIGGAGLVLLPLLVVLLTSFWSSGPVINFQLWPPAGWS